MAQININVTKVLGDLDALIAKLGVVTETVRGVATASAESFTIMQAAIRNAKATTLEMQTQIAALKKELDKVKRSANLHANAMTKVDKATKKASASTRKFTKEQKKSGLAMGKLMGGFNQLLGALGFAGLIVFLGKAILSVINLTIKFESLQLAIKYTAGSVFETGRSMQFLIELNDRFGADIASTTERWLKFRVAARLSGLTLLETKKIFESVTKASAVLGLRTDELRGIYLALEQMLSKGKVTTEELRRQLGERLPGAMGIMASALGLTIPKLDEMLKKGQILSADALPKFAEALERAYGIEAVETVDNLATAVGKMSGAWQQFVLTITEGDSIITKVIGGALEGLTEFLKAWSAAVESVEQKRKRLAPKLFGSTVTRELDWLAEIEVRRKGATKSTVKFREELKLMETQLLEYVAAGKETSPQAVQLKEDIEKLGFAYAEMNKKVASQAHLDAIARLGTEITKLDDMMGWFTGEEIKWWESLLQVTIKNSDQMVEAIRAFNESDQEYRERKLKGMRKEDKALLKQIELVDQLRERSEVSNPVKLDPTDPTSKRSREVKLAKPYVPNHEAQIIQLRANKIKQGAC